jgi:hypothetical protein
MMAFPLPRSAAAASAALDESEASSIIIAEKTVVVIAIFVSYPFSPVVMCVGGLLATMKLALHYIRVWYRT